MQSMLKADSPEERRKLASQLRKDLEQIRKFSSRKAGSKDLENSLDQALQALEALYSSVVQGKIAPDKGLVIRM